MDKLSWCKKKGVVLVDPNENLSQAYIKKARNSLNMLTSALEKKEYEWIALSLIKFLCIKKPS